MDDSKHSKQNFFLTVVLFFLIAFVYNLLRPIKIDLVAAASSEEASHYISYLKVWGILPGVFFFTFIFTRLSQWYKRDTIFYIMLSIFSVFFFVSKIK